MREPSESFPSCVSDHPNRSQISLARAQAQHENYVTVLEEFGLEVIKLGPDPRFPDGCFVEDTAVVHNNKALITRLGPQTRRGEENAIEQILSEYFKLSRVTEPGILEGGDVIHLPSRLICGLTSRTNSEGVKQLGKLTNTTVETVENPDILHLKSFATVVGDLVVTIDQYKDEHAFKGLEIATLPWKERYGTNTLSLGDLVLVSDGFPSVHKLLSERGYVVVPLVMSEFEKCQGALTCLSILF